MIRETGDRPLFWTGHSRHPPEGIISGSPKETAVWWTTPQHHPNSHFRNLTQEGYPMVSLLSSKIGGFAPIPSSGELPCEGQLHSRYSHGVGFQIFWCFSYVLQNEGFSGGQSANPPTNLLIKSNPTAGRCPQTVGHEICMAVGSQGAPPHIGHLQASYSFTPQCLGYTGSSTTLGEQKGRNQLVFLFLVSLEIYPSSEWP